SKWDDFGCKPPEYLGMSVKCEFALIRSRWPPTEPWVEIGGPGRGAVCVEQGGRCCMNRIRVNGDAGYRVSRRAIAETIVIEDYRPLPSRISTRMSNDSLDSLERRLGRLHARRRIGMEDEHEARVFGQRLNYFHPENWYDNPAMIG